LRESENIDADGTAAWEKASVLVEYGMISRETVFGRDRESPEMRGSFWTLKCVALRPGSLPPWFWLKADRTGISQTALKLCRYGWQAAVGKRVKECLQTTGIAS
jgi:hypothetical protein